MPVTLKETTSKKNKSKTSSIELLFFIALNLLAIPISTYQTYQGYGLDVVEKEWIAFVIALFSGLLFLAMNWGIRARRLEGKSHHWQALLYIIPLAISFFGNFNAFYSSQVRNQLFDQEVTDYERVLRETKTNAIAALDSSMGIVPLVAKHDQLMQNLESEAKGVLGFSGWRTRAEAEWQKVRNNLSKADKSGTPVPDLDPRMSESQKLGAAKRAAQDVISRIVNTRQSQIAPVKSFVNATSDSALAEIKRVKIAKGLNARGRVLLDEIIEANNSIGSKTDAYLRKNAGTDFNYDRLETSDENQLGTIKHTISSAFVKWDNPTATWFSLFISLIIDLAALFYILLFVPYDKKRGRARINNGPVSI